MAAIYAVYTSPTHPPIPNHLPTLIVTPHGQPSNILYSYLHTNFNTENYLLTPSPQGDLCVAKLFPPKPKEPGKASASDPGHSSGSSSRIVRCEASRNLKWSIANTGVISPIYKLSLPSPDSPDLPLFQVSKPNPNAVFWSMFYFAYAGHNIPPKRIEFGKIQKNPPGPNGGGTRISITGKTPEEKAVWQTLGEGNEDCVEWVVLCAALNLLDDEIMKAAEKNPPPPTTAVPNQGPNGRPNPVSLRDPGTGGGQPPSRQASVPIPQQQQQQQQPMQQQRPPQQMQQPGPMAGRPNGYPPPMGRGFPPGQGPPPGQAGFPPNQGPPPGQGGFPPGQGGPPLQGPPPGQGGPPQGFGPGPGPGPRMQQQPPPQMRNGMAPGPGPIPMQAGFRPPQMMPPPQQQQMSPQQMQQMQQQQVPQGQQTQVRRF